MDIKNKFKAFSLAEIVVTLMIIGVIAAITLPSLNNYIKRQSNITALKKAYSVLNQAYERMNLEDPSTFRKCDTNDSKCLGDLFKDNLNIIFELNDTASGNLPNCWNNQELSNISEQHSCLITSDGIVYDFDMEYTWTECANGDHMCAIINIDVNGLKAPNRWGDDRYRFILYPEGVRTLKKNATEVTCNNGRGTWSDNIDCAHTYIVTDDKKAAPVEDEETDADTDSTGTAP